MKATARVKVTVDLPVNGRWGEGCPIEQVLEQARREARDTVLAKFPGAVVETLVRIILEEDR